MNARPSSDEFIEAGSITKCIDQQDMYDFEAVVWNRGSKVHSDPAVARASGIKDAFASGMMQLSYMHEVLEEEYGDRWRRGGSISARWLSLVYPGDQIKIAWSPEPSCTNGAGQQDEIELQIVCTNQHGRCTAVATARARRAAEVE